jgi:hypothetical protein
MRDNTTANQGGQEWDATNGGGRGEVKLADARRRCRKRQHGNQLGQTRGKGEGELLAQCEIMAR